DNTVYYAHQWLSGYGGTSFSSPAVAGMLGSIIAFDGHPLGAFGPTLYALESKWLAGKLALPPTYFVQNYSNAFFNGATDYNTSAGWGVPLAYNIALDLGKPFVTAAPAPAAFATDSYGVTAHVSDSRPVAHVNVTYLEPGVTKWTTLTLNRTGGTPTKGTWTGKIPGATSKGTLEYCVYAVDLGLGNSWTPYNLSGWAASHGKTPGFGCASPFKVPVRADPTLPSGAPPGQFPWAGHGTRTAATSVIVAIRAATPPPAFQPQAVPIAGSRAGEASNSPP
ncbi:MAG: hypothetical protein L3J87_03880, partial [Thermoplasmata archaeon]|nr:hypothetical protein [Thermoplasmata archaeon]